MTIAVIVLACARVLARPRAEWVFAVGALASPLVDAGSLVGAMLANVGVAKALGVPGWYIAHDPLETALVGVVIGLLMGGVAGRVRAGPHGPCRAYGSR